MWILLKNRLCIDIYGPGNAGVNGQLSRAWPGARYWSLPIQIVRLRRLRIMDLFQSGHRPSSSYKMSDLCRDNVCETHPRPKQRFEIVNSAKCGGMFHPRSSSPGLIRGAQEAQLLKQLFFFLCTNSSKHPVLTGLLCSYWRVKHDIHVCMFACIHLEGHHSIPRGLGVEYF